MLHRQKRYFTFGGWKLRTPTIWLGHELSHQVKVWEHLPICSGLMVNAYQLLNRPVVLSRAVAAGMRTYLNFNGPLFFDSGGFKFQRQGKLSATCGEVLALYEKLGPDIAAVLDLPLNPLASLRDNNKRWSTTLANTAFMHENNGFLELAPVFHAYNLLQVERRSAQLREIISAPRVLCLGSLVPLLKASHIGSYFVRSGDSSCPTVQRWRFVTRLVLKLRRLHPDAMLHVFGAGSLSTMYLLFLMGVDSVDSVAWRLKAGYGAIQLPGITDRNLEAWPFSSRVRRSLDEKEYDLLEQCQCPICYGQKMEARLRLLSSFTPRAIHNAHVFISEVNLMREAKEDGNLAKFVTERLRRSNLYQKVLHSVVLPETERAELDAL
jgi:7-cyano-7-deazaguanine tRNA-ribosyltransferase